MACLSPLSPGSGGSTPVVQGSMSPPFPRRPRYSTASSGSSSSTSSAKGFYLSFYFPACVLDLVHLIDINLALFPRSLFTYSALLLLGFLFTTVELWSLACCLEEFPSYTTGSDKTLGTILRDPIVPSSVGQVELSGYSTFFVPNQLGKNNWFVDR